MANPSRRKKPSIKDEAIDVNELAGMSNMKGMLSFLDTKPEDYARIFQSNFPASNTGAPNVGAPEVNSDESITVRSSTGLDRIGAPNFSAAVERLQAKIGAPELGAPEWHEPERVGAPKFSALKVQALDDVGAPNVGAPELDPTPVAQHQQAPKIGAPELLEPQPLGAPTFGAPELGAIYQTPRASLRLVATVQDGHTHGEQALFATLWRLAKPVPGTNYRLVTIGERTLAKQVPMAYSTIQENLRSLLEKLAIDIQINGPQKPKTYRVYSFDEVLRRRKAAGLTHVLRRTSGAVLVNPTAPGSGAPNLKIAALRSGAPNLRNSAPSLGSPGAPNVGATTNKEEDLSRTTSSEVSPYLASAILNAFGFVDDDALKTLLHKCRENAPDATDEEIAELGAMTARRVARMQNVSNHVGLLITQTAKCFFGEPFAIYRREKAERERRFAQYQEE
jgi:hypothetical protein